MYESGGGNSAVSRARQNKFMLFLLESPKNTLAIHNPRSNW